MNTTDAPTDGKRASELPAAQLDDQEDREELRDRYYGLLQELRVVLPGVQVLVAFMLTAPFSQRFSELDGLGRNLFGVALVAGILSVTCFLTPIALHRFGPRTVRGERLQASIIVTRIGLALLAVSMTVALAVVARFLFGGATTVLIVAATLVATVGLWVILPLTLRHGDAT